MEINKQNRNELKAYFVSNAIPTEHNFGDLIDSGLNQKEDGLVKLAGDPLSIEAAGDAASELRTIHFYESFADAGPAWVLSLNPRATDDDPATGRAGFNLGDGAGNSRLFIDRTTGNVGIGTINPQARLHVQDGLVVKEDGTVGIGTVNPQTQLDVAGNVGMLSGSNPIRFTSQWSSFPDDKTNGAEISNDTSSYKTLMIIGNKSAGMGRRVSVWDRLEVNGSLRATGGLAVDGNLSAHVNADGAFYRYQGQVYITVDDNLYVRDTDGGSRFRFDTNIGYLYAYSYQYMSDSRLKKGVRSLGKCLARVSALSGVRFQWKEPAEDQNDRIGFLAQDVERIFPELVETGTDGMKSVNYAGLLAPVVEAVKEQSERIEGLEKSLVELRAALA